MYRYIALPLAVILAAGTPAKAEQREWREVFSPDGTITQLYVKKQVDSPLSPFASMAADVVALQETGPSSQRFDLVFVGDGYTSSQMSLLRSHAESKWAEVSSVEPFRKYKNYFNVWLVNVISTDSGVDNDPTRGISRNTAMDMGFWCSGIERLLCVNQNKALAFAANAPQVDQVMALANSTKYGGAGYTSGGLATASGGNAQSGQVAIHEFGHSLGKLADEYFTAGTTYTGGEPSWANASKLTAAQMTANRTKWHAYIGRATPDGGVIGTFQGANQYNYGIYRPSENSLMRTLGKPFNLVGLDIMDAAIAAKIVIGPVACAGYETSRTGSLSTGGNAYQPDNSWFQTTASGTHRACLDGATSSDFDLSLQKWNGSAWNTVASSAGSTEDKTVTYSGTAGYYRYWIYAASGSGTYTLGYDAP
ncbi:M64 family metallopeptidase [Catelliglobosispora koreensis]|uniref:M64 family metallopeptidase n=1 Tax=Catelliglobosispora koreensis TaxID=129052 RepID=UPI0003727B2D|nr:M64 family metallopeptidase [Catelliglobosispora koreensis]